MYKLSWNRIRLTLWLDFSNSNIYKTFTKSLWSWKSDTKYERQARHRPGIGVIFLCPATQVYSVLENRRERYFKRR